MEEASVLRAASAGMPSATRWLRGPAWVAVANLSQAAGPFLSLLIVAKVSGLQAAGALAYAQALTIPIAQLLSFQLKALILTHDEEELDLPQAVGIRLLTIAAGGIVAVGVLRFCGPLPAVLLMARLVDGWAEVYQSHWQREGVMDRAAASSILRSSMMVTSFYAAPSLELAGAVYLVLSLLLLLTFEAGWHDFSVRLDAAPLRRFLGRGFQLGVVMSLLAWQSSYPRLALESSGNLEALGAFAALSVLMQAGNLVASSYGQGLLPRFQTEGWWKMWGLILWPGLAGIAVLVGMFAAGDPILRLLGAEGMPDARGILLALGLAQLLVWPAAVAGCALTALRMYRTQIAIAVLLNAVSLVGSWLLVPRFGAVGVCVVLAGCAAAMLVCAMAATGWRKRECPL
jgi:O-antigen/teichoic acid export membrane protein